MGMLHLGLDTVGYLGIDIYLQEEEGGMDMYRVRCVSASSDTEGRGEGEGGERVFHKPHTNCRYNG